MFTRRTLPTCIATITLAAGCIDGAVGVGGARPQVDAAHVDANEHNVLSAVVPVRVRNADSVVVRSRVAGTPGASESRTPAVIVTADAASVPVLGLHPATGYELTVVAYGRNRATVEYPLQFTTGALPADLPRFTAGGLDPSPGYVLFATGKYTVVIDNGGRVVWYRRYEHGAGLNFMAQPTGHYVVRPPTPETADIEPWLELDALGNVTRPLTCANGLRPRLHDLILHADGSYRILCDETRTMDLTAHGGVAEARVTGTVVQHVSAAGALISQWSPFDHFEITDVELAERRGPNVNWTHGNAIELDADGNLLVSFRNLGEITKIDAATGAVHWRLGGLRNQFTFMDAPAPAFARQHGARWAGPGTLVLLDNLGDAGESRAERYVIDEETRTAWLSRSYGTTPRVVTEIGGSVQPLAGGRTLVSFGTAGRVEEYDGEGRVVWRIEGNPGYVFRAQRILSLYAPGVGTSR